MSTKRHLPLKMLSEFSWASRSQLFINGSRRRKAPLERACEANGVSRRVTKMKKIGSGGGGGERIPLRHAQQML